jgi:hypothetical protein
MALAAAGCDALPAACMWAMCSMSMCKKCCGEPLLQLPITTYVCACKTIKKSLLGHACMLQTEIMHVVACPAHPLWLRWLNSNAFCADSIPSACDQICISTRQHLPSTVGAAYAFDQ